MLQATPLGQGSVQISVPDGLLLDDKGASITEAALSPTDVLTALVAIAAATIDLKSNHTNFTLNNMIACLVATDILQVICTLHVGPCQWLSCYSYAECLSLDMTTVVFQLDLTVYELH